MGDSVSPSPGPKALAYACSPVRFDFGEHWLTSSQWHPRIETRGSARLPFGRGRCRSCRCLMPNAESLLPAFSPLPVAYCLPLHRAFNSYGLSHMNRKKPTIPDVFSRVCARFEQKRSKSRAFCLTHFNIRATNRPWRVRIDDSGSENARFRGYAKRRFPKLSKGRFTRATVEPATEGRREAPARPSAPNDRRRAVAGSTRRGHIEPPALAGACRLEGGMKGPGRLTPPGSGNRPAGRPGSAEGVPGWPSASG